MILAIRTDKPEAELYLLDVTGKQTAKHIWVAHRTLATSLAQTVHKFLADNQTASSKLTGLIVFTGAGSFTGLRIGATVMNALAYARAIPIVAGEGDNWIQDGYKKLSSAQPGKYVIPTYDRVPNITKPK